MVKKRITVKQHKVVKKILDGATVKDIAVSSDRHSSVESAIAVTMKQLGFANVRLEMKEALLAEGLDISVLAKKAISLLDAKKLFGVAGVTVNDNQAQLAATKLVGSWIGLEDKKEDTADDSNDSVDKVKTMTDRELREIIRHGKEIEAEYDVLD